MIDKLEGLEILEEFGAEFTDWHVPSEVRRCAWVVVLDDPASLPR
jgi:hypothetical protein